MNQEQTVFLVDDEPVLLRALSRFLKAEGYTTRAFSSGQEFIDNYDPTMSGCVVLDFSMPGITGPDVQQWLARSGSSMPVIFLSARDECTGNGQPRNHGEPVFLMKPVEPDTLLQCIHELLTNNRPPQTTTP